MTCCAYIFIHQLEIFAYTIKPKQGIMIMHNQYGQFCAGDILLVYL